MPYPMTVLEAPVEEYTARATLLVEATDEDVAQELLSEAVDVIDDVLRGLPFNVTLCVANEHGAYVIE